MAVDTTLSAGETTPPRPSFSRYLWIFSIVAIVVAILAASRLLMPGNNMPAEGSAEAGFARDMGLELADKFVGMYVNDWTLDYGEREACSRTCRRVVGNLCFC